MALFTHSMPKNRLERSWALRWIGNLRGCFLAARTTMMPAYSSIITTRKTRLLCQLFAVSRILFHSLMQLLANISKRFSRHHYVTTMLNVSFTYHPRFFLKLNHKMYQMFFVKFSLKIYVEIIRRRADSAEKIVMVCKLRCAPRCKLSRVSALIA